ncbi:hypothetical protein PSHT_12154 [Puccinia striiformis]|uniref:Uncharacterized protein n=1 Tax=Puccinia striiformis TaxID=27350 RepID=A0A2S4UYF5_9BASI|nr:hypothetical protein PSHT_12154 [Puccinia striiformis]
MFGYNGIQNRAILPLKVRNSIILSFNASRHSKFRTDIPIRMSDKTSPSKEPPQVSTFSRPKAPVFVKHNRSNQANPLDDAVAWKSHQDALQKKNQRIADLNQIIETLEEQREVEITRLKSTMKQMESESVEKQHLLEQRYERSTQAFSETLENINRQFLSRNKKERKLIEAAQSQSNLLLQTEEKLQDLIEENLSLRRALQKNSLHRADKLFDCAYSPAINACLNVGSGGTSTYLECDRKEIQIATPDLDPDATSQKDEPQFHVLPHRFSAMRSGQIDNDDRTNVHTKRIATTPEGPERPEKTHPPHRPKEHVKKTHSKSLKVYPIMTALVSNYIIA